MMMMMISIHVIKEGRKEIERKSCKMMSCMQGMCRTWCTFHAASLSLSLSMCPPMCSLFPSLPFEPLLAHLTFTCTPWRKPLSHFLLLLSSLFYPLAPPFFGFYLYCPKITMWFHKSQFSIKLLSFGCRFSWVRTWLFNLILTLNY